jgi:enoyl-CoA hydratase/carnithine racemase
MQEIVVTHRDRAAEIRLNRAGKKNAITSAMYAAMADALDAAANDASVRVVTILGSGGIFTAGNDIEDFMRTPPLDTDQPVFRFLRALVSFPKPVVAGVDGLAIGIGTTMLLHCDIVLAAPNASFSMPFVDLALVPEAASSLLFPRLVGQQRAAMHLLLGEPFDAATAKDFGLVAEIVEPDRLDEKVAQLAVRIAAKPPEALRIAKALLRAEPEPVVARMEREGMAFASRLTSPEAAEAFRAFFEKRPPNFN